ncbi:hypothetical protein MMC16_003303 [Acarospora aff. strigata]|nr:hypothetical protein [Acarospora aff. strigata]
MALQTTHSAKKEDNPVPPFALIVSANAVNRLCDEASMQCKTNKDLIQDIYPCSPMQQGLMPLSIKEAGSYVMQFVYSLPSSQDLCRFKTAWETVVTLNPILRTRCLEDNSDGLFQVVLKEPLQWQSYKGKVLESYLAEDTKSTMDTGQAMSRYAVSENSIRSISLSGQSTILS